MSGVNGVNSARGQALLGGGEGRGGLPPFKSFMIQLLDLEVARLTANRPVENKDLVLLVLGISRVLSQATSLARYSCLP